MKLLESSSTSAISSAYSTQTKLLKSSSSSAIKNFVMVDIQEHRDGLTSKTMRPPILTQREVESDQEGLMSYGTCHTHPPAAGCLLASSWAPSLRCTESEDSSVLSSKNLYQLQPVFFSTCFSLCSDVLRTVINSV